MSGYLHKNSPWFPTTLSPCTCLLDFSVCSYLPQLPCCFLSEGSSNSLSLPSNLDWKIDNPGGQTVCRLRVNGLREIPVHPIPSLACQPSLLPQPRPLDVLHLVQLDGMASRMFSFN